MSQRLWIVLVLVAAVVVIGFLFLPSGTTDTATQPTGTPETSEPAEEPASE